MDKVCKKYIDIFNKDLYFINHINAYSSDIENLKEFLTHLENEEISIKESKISSLTRILIVFFTGYLEAVLKEFLVKSMEKRIKYSSEIVNIFKKRFDMTNDYFFYEQMKEMSSLVDLECDEKEIKAIDGLVFYRNYIVHSDPSEIENNMIETKISQSLIHFEENDFFRIIELFNGFQKLMIKLLDKFKLDN